MLQRSTLQLLRFHFSLFLLPVFLFALSQLEDVNWLNVFIVFFILHILVYPASNGYNSYMDKDDTAIGGLQHPMQPSIQLLHATIILDVLAVLLSLLISVPFMLGILVYIMASKAYSYRGIRLKQYPVIGFFTVFIFQGALIFFITYHGCHPQLSLEVPLIPLFISSSLIGSLYPLTQIYQHDADKKDEVKTLSILLGKRGTFFFSMFLFLCAIIGLYILFYKEQNLNFFVLYLFCNTLVVSFFFYWMHKVWRDENNANFKNSLWMNIIATVCATLFFILLIIFKH